MSSQDGSKLNQSVQKAMTLLRATATHPGGTSVTALARAAGRAVSVREALVVRACTAGGPHHRIAAAVGSGDAVRIA